MTLPGVQVTPRESATASSPPTDTGTWFVAGFAERGPYDEAVLVRNLAQFERYFGERASYSYLWDSLQTFFEEGGARAFVGRVVGPAPVLATGNLTDGSGTTLVAKASSPGAWGNDIDVITSVPGSGTFRIKVNYKDVEVEDSGVLNTNAEALVWAATSDYIDLTDSGGGDPTAQTVSLATGTDDHSNATETQWANGLELFGKDLGPGQVSAPGRTTVTTQTALLAHASENNRVAVLDGTDTATVSTLTSQAATLRALTTARYGALFAPWAQIPGLVPGGAVRTVPYSAVQAGLIARSDAAGENANAAAAGPNGVSRYVVGTSQAAWSDADRETLNDAGVNVARIIGGVVETYGYRTLVNSLVNDTWLDFGNARLNMQIAAEAHAVGERFVFRQATPRTALELAGALDAEVLSPLYIAEALFGDTPEEAYIVDVGEQVNTDDTFGDGELHAVMRVRMTRNAERVEIEIVKETA